jgi:hypothetical protein
MAVEFSNHFFYMMFTKKVDLANDSIKVVLMDTGFTFDPDTHATYADVSASELATGYGYTQNTKTLTGAAVVEDDTNDRASATWNDPSWTASGGSIGPTPGAILFDDTTSDDTVIGFVNYGGDQTTTDGGTHTIPNIEIRGYEAP